MIIGVSGKLSSGKDTVGKIINYLVTGGEKTYTDIEGFLKYYDDGIKLYPYQIKKFADKLKDITCILLSCTRSQLEDREFKEKELGEEWWYIYIYGVMYPYTRKEEFPKDVVIEDYLIKLTPRKLLQLLGTECGRQIIHPNIWVNALFNEYKYSYECDSQHCLGTCSNQCSDGVSRLNWIITDTRFPNEAQAIKDREGIVIRDNRDTKVLGLKDCGCGEGLCVMVGTPAKCKFKERIQHKPHESETALDNWKFDYIIDNNGTLEELVEKVKQILINLNLIK